MNSFIEFCERETKGKTKAWVVRAIRSGDRLGEIRWYVSWRQYCFFPEARSAWSNDCLADVREFMWQHKYDRKGHKLGEWKIDKQIRATCRIYRTAPFNVSQSGKTYLGKMCRYTEGWRWMDLGDRQSKRSFRSKQACLDDFIGSRDWVKSNDHA